MFDARAEVIEYHDAMFDARAEVIEYHEEKKERLQEDRDREAEYVRYLSAAHDYLEEVITERESGDLLPSSTSRDVGDLLDRQMLISDRWAYHEEILDRVKDSLERWEDDLNWELEAYDFDAESDAA